MSHSSASDKPTYTDICEKAATDPEYFATFKSDRWFREILEHVPQNQGKLYYDKIVNTDKDFLFQKWDHFKTNDLLGSPLMFEYPNLGLTSPTTLRYISCALDMRELFTNLNDLNIVEIGGGYGGLCKILHDVWPDIASYTFFDLPCANKLSTKYLANFPSIKNIKHVDGTGTMEEFVDSSVDLVISNYGYSEVNQEGRKKYDEVVLKKSKRGYMMINFFNPKQRFDMMNFLSSFSKANQRPETCESPNVDLFTWRTL